MTPAHRGEGRAFLQGGKDNSPAMRRDLRHALLASLLALYGFLSAFGPGLHDLPGFGHAAASASHEGEKAAPPAAAHPDDCAACQFLSQAQALTDPASTGPVDVVSVRPPDEPRPVPPAPVGRTAAPRAPPFA